MAQTSIHPMVVVHQRETDSSFAKVPLDVLCEICGWLNPEDILALARTTKSFRGYLMSRTSRATIWRPALQALKHLKLPDCPAALSEPQFVHLLYDNFCDDCAQDNALPIEDDRTVHRCYAIYKSLCQDCASKNYTTFSKLIGELKDFPWSYEDLMCMIPALHPFYAGVNTAWCQYSATGDDEEGWSMLLHIDSFRVLRERWEGNGDPESLEYRTREDCDTRRKFAEGCERFDSKKGTYERETKEQNKQERLAWTKQRLSALGFEAEVKTFFHKPDRPLEGTRHYDIYRAKYSIKDNKLMEIEWATMEDELVSLMQSEREWWEVRNGHGKVMGRIGSCFKPAFIEFAFSEGPNAVIPTPLEVALTPEWVSVLGTKPYTDDPDPSSVAEAVAAMPAFAENIRKRRIHQLLDVVRKSKTYSERPEEVNVDMLSLASTIFRCRKCGDCIHYPSVLVHICNYLGLPHMHNDLAPPKARVLQQVVGADPESWPTRPIELQEEKAITYAFKQMHGSALQGGFWNDLRNIRFGDAEHEHALMMLDSLGMNRKTQVEVMEKEQPYVKCLCRCFQHLSSPGEPKHVMRWIKALFLCTEHEKTEKRKKWFTKPDKAHLSLIPAAELNRSTLSVQACFWELTAAAPWRCPWLAEIKEHYLQSNKRRWRAPVCHWDRLRIKHPLGDDARRDFASARTLVSSVQLYKERPLKLTLRRSDRKKVLVDSPDAEEDTSHSESYDDSILW